MKIKDREFSVHPLTKESHTAWHSFVIRLAKFNDKPIARFIATHMKGIPKDDRRDVLAAWMATPGWDLPSTDAINVAADSLSGTRALATYCFWPELSWDEACELITDENKEDIQSAVQSATNPTDDDILKSNQALRERIIARNEEAHKEEVT